MRAAILDRNGPLDSVRIGELDAPSMRGDEILVRVHGAAINPADLKVVTGKDGAAFLHAKKFPTSFGFDFSGVVEAVGSDVQGRFVGDEVFGFLAYARSTKQGSFAELVSVNPDTVGDKPSNISHEEAAAAATAGCTALQALEEKGRIRSGQKVLVNGASGGVGSYAVQIAAQLGAEVWGTASAAKVDFVKGLGAARVLDYKTAPLADIGEKFDIVLDAASTSSFGKVSAILEPGGVYVALLPSLGLLTGILASFFSSKRCGVVVVKSRTANLNRLAGWLGAGKLQASVDSTFSLNDITVALAAQQAGKARGKLVSTSPTTNRTRLRWTRRRPWSASSPVASRRTSKRSAADTSPRGPRPFRRSATRQALSPGC
jgi:NADPH:quinone reductase-like Zn-dependent oxidoreductase